VGVLLGLLPAAPGPRLLAQAAPAAQASPVPAADSRPRKSIYGKLQRVDKRMNEVIMITDEGKGLRWRVPPSVIAEVDHFKTGDRMIMIYREMAANEKRLTAIAFPGTATAPTYVNLTGARVAIRSTPFVDGVCGGKSAQGEVKEQMIAAGGMVEVAEDCWCCAASGESCTPGSKTGAGKALLVQCFE
jgi:hypothetical protein